MFNKLQWQEDRLLLNNLVFRLQQVKTEELKDNEDYFIFYKVKTLIDQYESYFATSPFQKQPKNIVEIGMWDGGSLAFWHELLSPDKIIGVDIKENGGNKYFNKFLSQKDSQDKSIIAYWGTDQSDAPKLRNIIKENFAEKQLDLVFDDGSHMYKQTLACFNALFPFMAEGSLYFIEDWAWSHWKGFENNLPADTEPSKLIYELVQASGNVGLIESLTVYQGFVVVKRGKEALKEKPEDFKLSNYIYNRPLSLKSKIKAARQLFK